MPVSRSRSAGAAAKSRAPRSLTIERSAARPVRRWLPVWRAVAPTLVMSISRRPRERARVTARPEPWAASGRAPPRGRAAGRPPIPRCPARCSQTPSRLRRGPSWPAWRRRPGGRERDCGCRPGGLVHGRPGGLVAAIRGDGEQVGSLAAGAGRDEQAGGMVANQPIRTARQPAGPPTCSRRGRLGSHSAMPTMIRVMALKGPCRSSRARISPGSSAAGSADRGRQPRPAACGRSGPVAGTAVVWTTASS